MDKAKLATQSMRGVLTRLLWQSAGRRAKGYRGESKQRFSFCYLSRRAYGTLSLRDAASLVEASPVAS